MGDDCVADLGVGTVGLRTIQSCGLATTSLVFGCLGISMMNTLRNHQGLRLRGVPGPPGLAVPDL
jgi:hypothetical protein